MSELIGAPFPANLPLHYTKLEQFTRRSERFRREEIITHFKINHEIGKFENILNASDEIEGAFDNLIQDNIKDYPDNYKISAYIQQKDLDPALYIPPQFVRKFKADILLTKISKILQSNKQFLLDGEMKLELCVTQNISGGARNNPNDRKPPKQLDNISKSKLSTVTINNKDNSCGYRALFVAKYYADNKENLDKVMWERVRRDRYKAQTNGALEIANNAGLNFNTRVGMDNLESIQNTFEEHQIIIVDARCKRKLMYRGSIRDKKIYIEFIDNHFNAITNIQGYIGRSYYCEYCHTGYDVKFQHLCKDACRKCYTQCKNQKNDKIKCNDCNRSFYGPECYGTHLISGLCAKLKKCFNCEVTYKKTHKCEEYKCKTCDEKYTERPHLCYMPPKSETGLQKEDLLPKVILSYDIESTQDNGIHRAMHLESKVSCDYCFGKKQKCKTCQWKTFKGYTCVKDFANYLIFELPHIVPKDAVIYAYAHNARGYDSHFVLRELWALKLKDLKVVMTGRKILQIKVGNVRLADSLSFFLQPLSTLPKAFGLDVNIRKGEFPHLFNTQENWNYVGKIPPLEYYRPEIKNPKAAKELRRWHAEKLNDLNYVFDFQKELAEYCRNDVEILDQCINTFRRLFISTTNIDPITRCFTLASIGLEVYKAKFYKAGTLGVTQLGGYNGAEDKRNSISGNCWLDWVQKEENIEIVREYKVGKYVADGYHPESKTLYEFFGCHWHGCLTCKRENRNTPIVNNKQTYNYVYRKTLKKLEIFKRMKYNVKYIWQCDYWKKRKQNKTMHEYTDARFKFYSFMRQNGGARIQESFFGGRTNNLKFYHECSEDEEIKYVDFCSLYPYVLSSKVYPIKHPVSITENFDYTLSSYFGDVKCKILPPRGLYIPVLPYTFKKNKKLIFTLCYTCAKNHQQEICNHSDEERSITNTWTTPELMKALEKGYKIMEIYEVLHYKETKDDLFSSYVYMWLKVKQQASGWPSSCKIEEDKRVYIQKYYDLYKIELEYEKIEINPALRFIAKIMLNSFWGKLAQRPNLPVTEYITSYEEYWRLTEDKRIELTGEMMVSDDVMMVTYKYLDDKDSKPRNYILSVASYVTAYARLELYNLMDRIETNRPGSVLYHDTDSVLYVQKKTDIDVVQCGEYLGDLTDEITKDYGENARCTKFVSLGPKNYGYEVEHNDTKTAIMKIKGISLTEKTLDILSLDKMLEMAHAYNDNKKLCVEVPQMQINTDRHNQLTTRNFNKIYQAVSTKRVMINKNETVPYGY